ncbi:transcriptional regulator with XRE-family HTH domain [Hydrogenispora ethanolica]|uniref:Transcriptional regulator with XRE-family HTH domain n=1 Tax=Hydrogenispora ethanolica TaxID=1082276 RepID=A0A4R1S9U1_HYDET|nr:helix-turn-helix transcriptional regulator [Hydrogenispora ethanolica]TCL75302.1 transcriptional regulator with XRE-family HTH domain [Hydrogenispora ethanolica]
MSTLGERIKNLRTQQNQTQDELAKLLCINRSTMANWETDRAQPDLDTLIKIANHFEVSLDFLATGRTYGEQTETDSSIKSKNAVSMNVTNEEAEVLKILRGTLADLTPDYRRKSLVFIKRSIQMAGEIVKEICKENR